MAGGLETKHVLNQISDGFKSFRTAGSFRSNLDFVNVKKKPPYIALVKPERIAK